MATNVPVTLDTLIVVKVQFQGNTRKFKIPLRDLGAQVLPEKLRTLLQVPSDEDVVFERYSDSAGAYVTLDSNKPQVYKTLFRAAKAKLKLRLRATIPDREIPPAPAPPAPLPAPLSSPPRSTHSNAQLSPVIARSPLPYPVPASEMKPQIEPVQASPVSLLVDPADAEIKDEAPVPRSFTARQSFFGTLAAASSSVYPASGPKMAALPASWVVYCNHCNLPMEDEHFHCSICDHGDYDLCPSCVESGVHCSGSGHWMVKRFVKNGCIVNSTTERVGPKPKPQDEQQEQEVPGAFAEEKPPVVELTHEEVTHEEPTHEEPTRTCNCCVQILGEKEFVTCTSCDDYDLCMKCHTGNKHGHHPAHTFKPATSETIMAPLASFLCNAGRNVRHSAVCDGCEKFIYGVRHKCLNCPDWDFCTECIKSAKLIHPGHRFVPIYEPLAEPVSSDSRHYGIYCDGPLCKDKENLSYIDGIRYKCAVCHDTDFCANCEAHPLNKHNHTHPLIKFKRPVRSVSVTTLNEDKNGQTVSRVGDREPARRSTATETIPVASSSNAATQVHTIADVKPIEEQQPKTTKEKIEIRDLLAEPVQEKMSVQEPAVEEVMAEPVTVPKVEPSTELDAHFIRDTIPDGSKICSGYQFAQVWTLRNPGPNAWPAGCSVRHVGGDNMLNIDNNQPLTQSELADASESNIIGRCVAPGEEISFRVVMKAPARLGTAISYWRLKTADGAPFGHRLWCDIQVVSPPTPPVQAAPILAPEVARASNSTPTITPYQRFQQAEMERLRMKQNQALAERTARLQVEALERLKKLSLRSDENENQTPPMLEQVEHEKMLRIQQVRKAAVERLLENRRKEHEAWNVPQRATTEPTPKSPVKEETAELPVEETSVQAEPQPQDSGMIFPQLEKESPASSTHEAVSVQPKPETAAAAVGYYHEDFFEDAESVEIRSVSTDEDGFMTDEEYDILDASDEEMP